MPAPDVVPEPPGERDLAALLRTLDVVREPGTFVVAELQSGAPVPAAARAVVREREGTTVVLEEADAARLALAATFPCAWLTLTVHSSLEAVGLTAAFARALADAGIAANVLAGLRHDHLLVPVADAERAVHVLRGLRGAPPA